MEVKFNVKRKYIVNGKEYASIEEMSADIRKAYESAVSGKEDVPYENISSLSTGKIVFNGHEYDSVDLMPLNIRQMYETIMKSVQAGNIPSTVNVGLNTGRKSISFKNESVLDSDSMSKPIVPKSIFSSRVFIVGAAVIMLLIGLYFLFYHGLTLEMK